MVIMIPYLFIF